ncbi:MAG: hypothetical protein M0023_11390 [Desulfobacteraceae bacterium]|nr:hypothetical protein [Desulfobacteraceae bacterium]
MRYRRLVLTFIAALALFAGGNYLVWKCWTEALLSDRQYQGGDLARMGYIDTSKQYRKNSVDLPRRHVELTDYTGGTFDVITIGDSFSNGGAGGRNRFYQDYIASINGMNVLNIPPFKDLDMLSTISTMLNSGFFDSLHPRYVLVSCHEWSFIPALASPLDFSTSMKPEDFKRLKPMDYNVPHPVVNFINTGNAKFVLNKLLYQFSDHAYFSRVYKRKLKKPMFTAPDDESLLFLRTKTISDHKALQSLNDNLNNLADRLSTKGITLVFMPCVDKFTMYSEFLVDNPYPVSTFFEDLNKLPKRYRIINTKNILLDPIRRGEKDIFYADDTHWSWKASEAIFNYYQFN